ncbi:hypothetical protein PCANC_00722 [Puccinia coronata f. sp. avenae]|uniref:Uncharacterized protein n=1 Tax=Puccinia coronata f. sp. avenae TaxID=200324 RepID=A0A2N5W6S7_9BASI|nr:hypothetical protein PCANC_23325 [Puccinia coronata f. sp. avenae]PLW57949.1 hypothetical protein PCANC_00722 [Puccinia coronata f. sp. avenae]
MSLQITTHKLFGYIHHSLTHSSILATPSLSEPGCMSHFVIQCAKRLKIHVYHIAHKISISLVNLHSKIPAALQRLVSLSTFKGLHQQMLIGLHARVEVIQVGWTQPNDCNPDMYGSIYFFQKGKIYFKSRKIFSPSQP